MHLDLHGSFINRPSKGPRCVSTSALAVSNKGLIVVVIVVIILVGRLRTAYFLVYLLVHIVLPLLLQRCWLRSKVASKMSAHVPGSMVIELFKNLELIYIPRVPSSATSCTTSERPEPIAPFRMPMVV